MLKRILEIIGIKYLDPVLVEYWDTIIWNFALIGIGVFSDRPGFILFGSANALIYFIASIYTYKTKRSNPIFDFLFIVVVIVAAISLSITFIGKSLFLGILFIAITIALFYGLYKKIREAYFKNSLIDK